jgi:DNA-binding response OmpR family regulator
MSYANILVAEDFAAFREFVCRELERRPEFRVVPVGDGMAAVETAAVLQPDVVVLDIRLPTLHGLAAAERIRSLSPASHIVFLSQESTPEVVHAALNLGSRACIHKTRARYLLPAVEAILDGAGGACRQHQACFHSDDATLLDAAEHCLGSALTVQNAAVAIITRPHLQELVTRLKAWDIDVDRAVARGAFVPLDADEIVSQLRADGVARSRPSLIHTIESAAAATRPGSRVAVFGESASMLLASGHAETAIALEQLGTEIVHSMPVDILCTHLLGADDHDAGFKALCAHHGAIAIR